MPPPEDMELLREYVDKGSERAFEDVLKRHINLVYSTALRQVRDAALAAEVTQTTFIILARKARSLGRETVLSGWLYRTAQFAAGRVLRTEARRRQREREAVEMQTEPTDSVWEQLAPVLDRAMAHLSAGDRDLILLRYFENKTSKDVGDVLGINEAAAQKRVARAVEKLRALCLARGVVLPAAALVTLISARAVQAAPTGVTSTTAAAAKGIGIAKSTVALTHGTLKSIAFAKFKVAAISSLGLAAVVGIVVLVTEMVQFEPAYQGRSESAWLVRLDDGGAQPTITLRWEHLQPAANYSTTQTEALEAVRAMGTNGLPRLLAMLETKKPARESLFGKKILPSVFHHRAELALEPMGTELEPLLPELTRILHEGASPKETASILAAAGPDGWKILTRAISDTNSAVAMCSIWALGSHRAFVPGDTVEALTDKFVRDDPVSINALCGWALVEIGQDREKVESLLIDGLKSQRWDSRWGCAVALGHMGRDAEGAVPSLIALLHDRDPVMRHDAAQAIEQIDPQAAARAGVAGALATEHVPRTIPDL